ncbi:MAG: hypothetical protein K2V38_04110 [Gemmataceae bacterium]|nr:hypothetical protein [Gemmataceae bacterium]
MRRLVLLVLLLASVGCNRYAGPRETRQMGPADGRAPDGTRYTIEEQKVRGRERLAITEDDFRIGPNGYIDRPSPIGR